MTLDLGTIIIIMAANALFWAYGICTYKKIIFYLPRELSRAGMMMFAIIFLTASYIVPEYYALYIVGIAVASFAVFGGIFLMNKRNGNFNLRLQAVDFDEEKGLLAVIDAFNAAIKNLGGAATYDVRAKMLIAKKLSPDAHKMLLNLVKNYSDSLKAKVRFLVWPAITTGISIVMITINFQ